MKQLKRLTSVLLVLGIVLGLMPLSAFAAEPANTAENTITVTEPDNGGVDTYIFEPRNDGTVELTGFSTTAEVAYAEIPSTAQGYSVTSIGMGVFAFNNKLKTVTLPDSVTSVGIASFNECENLKEVYLGNSVDSIGTSAFAHCKNMEKLTIPKSVRMIGYGAFTHALTENTGLKELHYTGTEEQWNELMKKDISHADDEFGGTIGTTNPLLTKTEPKNFYCAHTVSFYYGNQAEETSKVVPKVVQYEKTVNKPTDPIAKGYQFDGWYTQENGGVPFDFEQEITKDVTVYAHWSVKPTPTPDPKPNPNPNPNPNPDPNPNPNPDPEPNPNPNPNPTPTPTPNPNPNPDPNPDAKEYTLTEKDGSLVRVTVVENGTTVDITEKVVLEKEGATQIGKIPAGAMVTVAANAAPEGMVFAQWNISDPALMGDPDVAHTSQTMSFSMPAADVTVEAMYESAENARETELLGSAALIGAVGISAVVLAYQAHQLGTELYLKYLLPSGAALPQNRIQLAELLWRNAGEPVPDVNAMYEDIGLNEEAAQQAAQWAVENELMELPDEEHTEQFKPDEQISYGEAIRAWKKAQQLKTAE